MAAILHDTATGVMYAKIVAEIPFGDILMANIELVQLVKRGRDAVAAWREENPNQQREKTEGQAHGIIFQKGQPPSG